MGKINTFLRKLKSWYYSHNIGGVNKLPIKAEINGKKCYLHISYDIPYRKWCIKYEYEYEGKMLIGLMLHRKHFTEAVVDMLKTLIDKGIL